MTHRYTNEGHAKLVLVVRRKRVELLIELLGGDYGTHSGIVAPPLGTLFSQPNISCVKTQFLIVWPLGVS